MHSERVFGASVATQISKNIAEDSPWFFLQTLLHHAVFTVAFLLGGAAALSAQSPLVTDADSTRYFAAHGERGFVGGNRAEGVEAYLYPLQLFRGLQVSFRVGKSKMLIDGASLLRRNTYAPTFVERQYVHRSFRVTERISMVADKAGGMIEYTVDAKEPITVELSFVPVLDLMWPGGIGGQEIHWSRDLNAYLIEEPTHRFAGVIGSPETSAHDSVRNSNAPTDSETRLHLELGDTPHSRVFFTASSAGIVDAETIFQDIAKRPELMEKAALEREKNRANSALEIVTPNEEVNQALAWSELALRQAWACNPGLGCGLVGGYGPSRGISRRPQYAWFFAGDALDSLPALLDAGYFEMAKVELVFLFRYQDKQTGMMWHELSQSAPYLRWTEDYPYAFAHVDITPAFLTGVAQYLRATSDTGFVRDHWKELASSYRYVLSLLDKSDGLPRVPAGKAAHDEQLHPPQELELATDCLEALRSYAFLSGSLGYVNQQKMALRGAERIARGIVPRFWNEQEKNWYSGIGNDGQPTHAARLPSSISLELLSQVQRDLVLNRLDSVAFQTPWGIRSMAVDSPAYNPEAYAAGSVWAKSTSEASSLLWLNDRPERAWTTWSKLLPWLTADSAGHIHEVMSGTEFRPQEESVAEQTWSSALMFSSFVEGVLGLRHNGPGNQLTVAPKLPADWKEVRVKRLRIGDAYVDLTIDRQGTRLAISTETKGAPAQISVDMKRVLGSGIESVELDGQRCAGGDMRSDLCVVRVKTPARNP